MFSLNIIIVMSIMSKNINYTKYKFIVYKHLEIILLLSTATALTRDATLSSGCS